jgi:hypothetical protein
VLRSLVDPNAAPVRAEPKENRDLAIAANNGWAAVFDNLSWLSSQLSDALCRLSTGGGFATRQLYSDDEEVIFHAKRPIILTGIEELASKGDLVDRALFVTLPTIPKEKRKTEKAFRREFATVKPAILGALLDVISAGLRNLPSVELEELPRMADFATWVVACERALGLKSGAFLRVYEGNRDAANELALESHPVAKYLRELADANEGEGWLGSATELLALLNRKADHDERTLRIWPKTARGLSGALRRLAPNLRQAGVAVKFTREPGGEGGTRRRLVQLEKSGNFASLPSLNNGRDARDAKESSLGTQNRGLRPCENPANNRVRDGRDGRDAKKPTFSKPAGARALRPGGIPVNQDEEERDSGPL